MPNSSAYMMNARDCRYLKAQPDLAIDACEALAAYVDECEKAKCKHLNELFVECENAKKRLNKRLDEIFMKFNEDQG
jgi:hypothetical protein